MTDRKRDAVKYVRDKAKNLYKKDTKCYISGETENLEFHHLKSISKLLEAWLLKKGLKLNTITKHQITLLREPFIQAHRKELYDECYTLTKEWHQRLHGVFGQRPSLNSADKQRQWIEEKKASLGG